MQTIWLGYCKKGESINYLVLRARRRGMDIPSLALFDATLHSQHHTDEMDEYWMTLEDKSIPTPDDSINPNVMLQWYEKCMGVRKKHPHKRFKSQEYDDRGKYQYDDDEIAIYPI